MRLLLGFGFLCAFVFSTGFSYGQGNSYQSDDNLDPLINIVGKWQMDEKSVLKEMKNMDKEKQENMPDKVKVEIEKSLASKIFIFNNQGVFSSNWNFRDKKNSVEGKYYIQNRETLGILVNGQLEQFIIQELNKDSLVLIATGNQRGMINKLFFTRISEQ